MRYRKLPVEIEAVKWAGDNADEVARLQGISRVEYGNGLLVVHTLEGDMRADLGDYIIRGVKGELYPCKPDIFEATYEAAG